jgi:hypothetical protein
MPPASPDRAQEIQSALDQLATVVTYGKMREDIEAACEVLEIYRSDFEELVRDEAAVMERARRLFSEDQFSPMRYTRADVHRAFKAVGYPRFREELHEEDMETIIAALLHLADDMDYRHHLARWLVTILPDYVAGGRYLDACLIQHSAFLMVERSQQANPFLFVMFQHGLAEWSDQMGSHHEALFRQLDIDRSAVSGMDIDEVDAWVQERMADAEAKAQLEAYYAAHPDWHDRAQSEFRDLERSALQLLDRDDAGCLHLPPNEVVPWLPGLQDRLDPLVAQFRQGPEREDPDGAGTLQDVKAVLMQTAREMIPAIFTPARVDRLLANLREYRRDLTASGEREASMWTYAVSLTLEHEARSSENPLLLGICYASLRRALIALADEARSQADGAQDRSHS